MPKQYAREFRRAVGAALVGAGLGTLECVRLNVVERGRASLFLPIGRLFPVAIRVLWRPDTAGVILMLGTFTMNPAQ